MNTNSISKPITSQPKASIQNCGTVCGLCEGIGKQDHPRSKKAEAVNRGGNCAPPVFYIYLHYPHPALLRNSHEQYRCQTCRLILSYIQHKPIASVRTHSEQANDNRDRLASFNIERDTYEAANILRSDEVGYEGDWIQLEGCSSGRIALCIEIFFNNARPRAKKNIILDTVDVDVYVFGRNSVAVRASRGMQLICSPGQ